MFKERFRSHHSGGVLKDLYRRNIDKVEYLSQLLQTEATRRRTLYFHVPYCTKLCRFCQFPQGDKRVQSEYHKLIVEQIKAQRDFPYMRAPFESVYFGGGTPTSLEPYQMGEILKCINDSYNFTDDCDISVETSITELDAQMIDTLLENGVNRLSIGVQSFNDDLRKLLGRRGNGQKAFEKIKELQRAGFKNINIDLIYNNPGQTLDMLKGDLDRIIESEIAGFSFYGLILMDNSTLSRTLTEAEKISLTNIDFEYEQFRLILDTLRPYGYEMFEFTKLIRNKMDKYKYIDVRHSGGDTIGLGLGAGGNIGGYTYYNMFDFESISEELPFSVMGSVFDDKYHNYDKFLGDIQKKSVRLSDYNNTFEMDLGKTLAPDLEVFEKEKLCIYENGVLSFTDKGSFWGNNISDVFLKRVIENLDIKPQPRPTGMPTGMKGMGSMKSMMGKMGGMGKAGHPSGMPKMGNHQH